MAELERLVTATDPLLACSICRCMLREAVLLKCLHNCCRQCFCTAAAEDGCREGVCCRSCGAVTQVGNEQPNGFIDRQLQRYKAIAESRWCGKCREHGEHDKPALVWCPKCRYSLCGDCVALHKQFNRLHVTQSLEELKSLDEVCSQPSVAACGIHGKPLDILCLNCEEAKCTSCWASCKEKEHKVHVVGEKSFDSYVSSMVACISAVENELLRKLAVLEKSKIILQDTKAARDRHLEDLNKRKRRVVDAVEEAYEKMALCTKDAYDGIEAEGVAAAEAAERIASDLSDARSYISRLVDSKEKCELFKQQNMLTECLSTLSAELDNLSGRLATTMREVKIEYSLPDNVEDVVRSWIGAPRTYSGLVAAPPQQQRQQQQSFSFGATSASFNLSVNCWDVALTKDGRSLLLAAQQHGLIELSSTSGRELSCWHPPKLSSSGQDDRNEGSNEDVKDDWVVAVAALSDRRAAVSVQFAQLVVLLRRCEKDGSSTAGATPAAAGDCAWTEVCRIGALPWPVRWMSAHGDVLAASERTLDEQTNEWQPGQRLLLLSLSSRRQLGAELQREYCICSLVVAADMVVTGSWGKVELGGGRRAAQVLDAHSLTEDGSDTRLWRHVLTSCSRSDCAEEDRKKDDNEKEPEDNKEEEKKEEAEEEQCGVCLDFSGGCLYAAVHRRDLSSSRVSALSLADGSELRRVALSFTSAAAAIAQLLLLPVFLSLCEDGAASAEQQQSSGPRVLLLAALCWDKTTNERRTVTLHRSTSDVLN